MFFKNDTNTIQIIYGDDITLDFNTLLLQFLEIKGFEPVEKSKEITQNWHIDNDSEVGNIIGAITIKGDSESFIYDYFELKAEIRRIKIYNANL